MKHWGRSMVAPKPALNRSWAIIRPRERIMMD